MKSSLFPGRGRSHEVFLAAPSRETFGDPEEKPCHELFAGRARESRLQEITSRFVHKISSRMLGVSSSEIRVADLICRRKSSKEIRKKLELRDGKLNLPTYPGNLRELIVFTYHYTGNFLSKSERFHVLV